MKDQGLSSDESRSLRLRDRWRGAFVLFMGMVMAILMILWSKEQVRKRNPEGATVGSLRGIVGWPDKIDVVASLQAARRHAQISELRGIVMDGVGFDGRVNLKNGDYSSKFVFISPPQPGKPGKARKSDHEEPRGAVCAKQSVKLRRRGLKLEEDRADAPCPSELGAPLPVPKCGPKEVWERALSKGAPKEALARMEYYRSKGGPAWKMTLPKKRFMIALSDDCKRELTPSENAGKVP